MALRELKILNTVIKPGSRHRLNLNSAKLYTATSVEVPIIIERSKLAGPVILLSAGIHGDEVNGVEIVRQIITKRFNRPIRGTVICVPVLNIFGFLNMSRMFPDGRDLNRSFPGSKNGSLASRFAYNIVTEILPHVDIVMDFHTGGAQRFNAPQLRVDTLERKAIELAKIFKAPFLLESANVSKTLRATCSRLDIPYLLFEGGMSGQSDKAVVHEGVQGVLRVLKHLEMLSDSVVSPDTSRKMVLITRTKWVRASHSGLLHPKVVCGQYVETGHILATITDPYGAVRNKIKAMFSGFVINVNQTPLVYQGDAIFHLSVEGEYQEDDQEPTEN